MPVAVLQRGKVDAHWGARIGVAAGRRGRPRWRHPVDAQWPGRSRGVTTARTTPSRRTACRLPPPEPAAHRSSAPPSHQRSAPQTGRDPACPSSRSTDSPAIMHPSCIPPMLALSSLCWHTKSALLLGPSAVCGWHPGIVCYKKKEPWQA